MDVDRSNIDNKDLQVAIQAASGLVFFRYLTDRPVFKCWFNLIEALLKGGDIATSYTHWLAEITPWALQTAGDAWHYYLNREISLLDNDLPRRLQSDATLPANLLRALNREAALLRQVRFLNAARLGEISSLKLGTDLAVAYGWGQATPELEVPLEGGLALVNHYRKQGSGHPALYRILKWDHDSGLTGVDYPDPVMLDDLVGYQRQKGALINNTRRLLSGLPAHHALLYGPRGSGKSSLVKAVANHFAGTSLRLLEVSPADLSDLPAIVDQLRGRSQQFIVFIDDLSFEAYETEYKSLKALLEGTVESRPSNLVVYATSNRRHIVQEFYSDRIGEDDLHSGETRQEKLALADRFGLSIYFPAADQELYLQIVKQLTRRRGINILEEELVARALTWEKEKSGPSGRVARQFVDSL